MNDYYPFGLTFNHYESPTGTPNYYKYNSFEEQQETGWYDYQARYYDPALGRFLQIDPMAEISRKFSPYTYAMNNPIRYVDPDGMMTQVGDQDTDEKEKNQAEQKQNQEEPELPWYKKGYTNDDIDKAMDDAGQSVVDLVKSFGRGLHDGLKNLDKKLQDKQVPQKHAPPEKTKYVGEQLTGNNGANGPSLVGENTTGQIDVKILQDAWSPGFAPGGGTNGTADIVKTAVSEAVNIATNAKNTVNEIGKSSSKPTLIPKDSTVDLLQLDTLTGKTFTSTVYYYE